MSYSRSYKSSSYRYSADGTGSSRTRESRDEGESSLTSYQSSSSRRTTGGGYSFDDGGDDDFSTSTTTTTTSRRLASSSRFSTDDSFGDGETGGTRSRYSATSKYKSYLSRNDDDESSTALRSYNRFSSRDDEDLGGGLPPSSTRLNRYSSRDDDDLGGGLPPPSSSRLNRYSTSFDAAGGDDFSSSYSTSAGQRRQGRYSYFSEEGGSEGGGAKSAYTRRYTTDLDTDLHRMSSMIDEEGGEQQQQQRRYQSNTSKTFSRLDSKDAAGQVYEAILDYKPPRSATDEICLKEGQEVVVLSKDKPHKWRVRTRRSKNFTTTEEGFAPSAYLKATSETVPIEVIGGTIVTEAGEPANKDDPTTQKDLRKKKDMIVRELLETEEDLIRDMQFVQRTYIRQSESSITPKEIKAVKADVFGCFKDIFAFHQDVMLKNLQKVSKEPAQLGTVFLRLANNFSDHTKYFKNLPKALEILEENSDVAEFFNNYAMKIRDEKTLADHLKMPLQRFTDYQLLLKELSKLLSRMDDNVEDLEKAVKLIATIPDKTEDDEAEDLDQDVSLDETKNDITTSVPQQQQQQQTLNNKTALTQSSEKLSKMLKNVLQAKDFFDVIDSEGKKNERFIFLFKTSLFITQINKNISESQRSYEQKQKVKLSEIEASIDRDNPKAIIITSKDLSDKKFPIELRAKNVEQAYTWLDLITKTPSIDDEDKSEQDLLSGDDNIFNMPTVIDENNNKINDKKEKINIETTAEEPPAETASAKPSETTADKVDVAGKDKAEEKPADKAEEKPKEKAEEKPKPEKATRLKITEPLKSITKHVGESVTFECKVSPGNCNVQWLKDNKIFNQSNGRASKSGADKYCLSITNLALEDAGMFTFIASDTTESVSSSSTLNVLSAAGDSRPTSPGGSFLPHAPKFKVKLKDTELLQGTTVRFEVVVRGLPVPSITFFKDSKPLKEDDHLKILFQSKEVFEVFIEHVKPEDAGHYKCVAINPEGQDETAMQLKVTDKKDVFWGLNEKEKRLEVDSPRCASPAFRWFKDGKEFEASERFQVQFDDQEDTIALIFQHVKPGDAGLYTCVASTGTEKISCSAELSVQGVVRELPRQPMVPEIKKHLTNVSVGDNENVAVLEAQVSGFPAPKIRWLKGDEQLVAGEHYKMLTEGQDSYTLMIKNVASEDAGHYRLEASNELGTVESEADLTVLRKPQILKITDKVEVMESEMLVIEAHYQAVPAPKIHWLKDGKAVKMAKGRVEEIVEEGSCKLVIHKASLEDVGAYQCRVCNELGEADKVANVVVNSKPKFLKRMEAIEVFEGEVAKFYVEASASPKAEAEFYREEVLIKKDNKRMHMKEEGDNAFSLVIDDAKPEDKGKYQCKLKNKYGHDEDSAELIIKFKEAAPAFKEQLRDIEAKLNDEGVTLGVKINGQPKPTVKWFHNGKEIKEGEHYKIATDDQGSTLLVPKMAYDHHGLYECQIENAKGMAKTSGNLIVNGPPYVVRHLENVATTLESDVHLTAIIKGNPTPEVKWYLGEEAIKLDSRHKYSYDEASAEYTLIVRQLQLSDLGSYRIEASNVYGKCESTAKVETMAKPRLTKGLENIAVEEMKTNVEMVVQLDKQTCQPLVKWFKDDKEIKDNDKHYKKIFDKLDNSYKLVVAKATEEVVGKYKCQVANDFGCTESAARFDIITKPKFLKGLENRECLEGDTVSMTVQVKGFPKPEVTFYKDGRDVSAEATIVVKQEVDDIYVLEIENIRIIMSGEYECRIRNEAGEAASKGVVLVKSKPTIVKDLHDLDVQAGEDISLEVVITGKPSPEIKWFKNGKEIAGNERVLLDSHDEVFTVKVPDAKLDDAGVYHCLAENAVGKVKSNDCNVKVHKDDFAPKFTKHLQDAIVVVDDNVRFQAEVQASPAAEVRWYKDGAPLKPGDRVIIKKDDNSDVLILKGLKLDDSGVITCEAKNAQGCNKETANLEVHEPTMPTISGLKDVALVHDEPVNIDAIVTGFPKPIVEWYKDGQPVDGQLVVSEPKQDRYGLKFEPFTSDQAGKYTCSAVNSAGEAIEQFAIDVCGKKPVFIKELEETIVMSVDKSSGKLKLGQSAIFETIVEGIPTPKVTWLKHDTPLSPSHRVTINNVENEHRLEIKEITKNDVAKYTCRAVNDFGEANSVCLLKFLNEPHPPIVKKELENIQLEEGEELKLVSKVDGEPMPAVKWYKNDGDVDDADGRIKVSSRSDGTTTLLIEKSLLADSGVYEVRAENTKGAATSTCKVLVVKPQRPPSFTQPLKEQVEVDYNKPLVLEAVVFGLPAPTIEWLKDGKPLPKKDAARCATQFADSGKAVLKIDRAISEDAGQYSLRATNPNGQVVGTSTVQVSPKPYAPLVIENLPVKVEIAQGECLQLKAKIAGDPLPQIQWKKDGVPIVAKPDEVVMLAKPDGEAELTILAAKPEDQGCYEVAALNSLGEISTSTQVNVLPALATEDVLEKPLPDQVDVQKGEPLVLCSELLRELPVRAKIEWTKDGQHLAPNNAIDIEQTAQQLQLRVDQPTDASAGVYKLIVHTPEGIASTEAKVNVITPLANEEVLEKLPHRLDVPLDGGDEPIVLKAQLATHVTPSDVIWTKDEQPIVRSSDELELQKKDNEYSLIIKHPTSADSGVYKLVAKTPDNVGLVSASKVTVLPALDEQQIVGKLPAKVDKAQQEDLLLEAVVKDFTPTEVSWTKDGQEIQPTTDSRFAIQQEGPSKYSLKISQLEPSDSGTYKLVATTPEHILTQSAELTVYKQIPEEDVDVRRLPDVIEKRVGDALEVETLLSNSVDIADVILMKNDQVVKPKDAHVNIVKDEHKIMLNIDPIEADDAGDYKLLIKTPDAIRTKAIKLNVFEPIVKENIVVDLPTEMNISEREPLVLRSSVKNFTPAEFAWTRDDQPIEAGDGVRVEHDQQQGTFELVLDNPSQADSGVYQLVAKTPDTMLVETAKVNVLKPVDSDKVTCHLPHQLQVEPNEPLELKSTVRDYSPEKVVWTKDDHAILPDDGHVDVVHKGDDYILKIAEPNVDDTGVYKLVAMTSDSIVSESTQVIVGEPRKTTKLVKQLPQMIQTNKGKTLVLETQLLDKSVPCEIRWQKIDSEELPPRAKSLRLGDTARLEMRDTRPTDSGVYQLIVSTPDGRCESTTTKVCIISPLSETKITKKLPKTISTNVGEPLRLEAEIKESNPLEIQWIKDGRVLQPMTARMEMKHDKEKYSFAIDQAKASDAGVYELLVKTPVGYVATTAEVKVEAPEVDQQFEKKLPERVEPTQEQILELKAVLTKMLSSTANMPADYVVWSKDDQHLKPNDRIDIQQGDTECTLQVNNLRPTDSGVYKLSVHTPEGIITTSTQVKVLKPVASSQILKKLPKKIDVKENQPLVLETIVEDFIPTNVAWTKDGQRVEPSDHVDINRQGNKLVLSIPHSDVSDAGHYELLAKSPDRFVSQSSLVEVATPISDKTFAAKLPDKVEAKKGEPIVLQASVGGRIRPKDITWLKDDQVVKPNEQVQIKQDNGQCSLEIGNAQPEDSGVYKLKVETPRGVATTATELEVCTPVPEQKIIHKLPDNVVVNESEPLLLKSKVHNFQPDVVMWSKDGSPLEPNDRIDIDNKDGELILRIDNPSPNDSGSYKLIAKSKSPDKEELSDECTVKVLKRIDSIEGPGFKPEPTDSGTYKMPGKTKLSTKDEDEDELTIQKLKRHDSIEGDGGLKPEPSDSGTYKLMGKTKSPDKEDDSDELTVRMLKRVDSKENLIFEKDEPTDSGSYKLGAKPKPSNKEEDSNELNVRILKRADSLENILIERALPAHVTIFCAEALELSLKLSSAKDICSSNINVFKDDLLIVDNQRLTIKVSPNGEIEIRQIECRLDDKGLYRVEIVAPQGTISNSCQVQVLDDKDKIKFIKDLQPIEGESGQSVLFEARIDGNPADFNITWYKDGEEIVPNEHYGMDKRPDGTISLLVDSFAAIDAGQYMVKVRNNAGAEGTSSAEAKLKAGQQAPMKPTFVNQLESCSVDEKSPLVLKCKVASNSPFTSKWYFGDKLLDATSKDIKFLNLPDGTVMLQIDNAKKEDAGKYRVEVSNASGKESSEAVVKVNPKDHKAPKMLKELQASELIAGKPGFIELQVDSLGDDAGVKFFKDGKPIVPDDRIHKQILPDGTVRLAFDNVLLSDAGDYTAIVKNNSGEVQSKANVIVKSKPIFTKGLFDMSVKDGCSVKFEVQVEGNPKAELTWMKNGFDLEVDTRHIKLHQGSDGTHYLLLDKCNFRDEAEYSVKASNELGDAITSCKLSVIRGADLEEGAPKFLKELGNINFKPGDTIKLGAQVDATKASEFIWKKDGNIIKMSDRVLTNFDGQNVELTILDASLGDAGQYELTVKNALGEATSRATASTLKEGPPKFTKKLQDKEENVTISTKLVCALDSYPESTVQWLFNDKPIETGIKFGIYQENGEHVLTIDNPNEFDSGCYQCVAINKFGTDKTSGTIHFIDKDKKGESAAFITKFCDFDVLAGGVACFTACVVGDPKPELKWFRNDKPLDLSDSRLTVSYQDNGMIKLQIDGVTEADLGRYRCQASNIYGTDNTIGQLNFETTDGLDRMKETHKSKKSQMRALDSDKHVEFRTGGVPDALGDKPTILKMTDDGLTLFWMPSIPERPRFPVSYVVEFTKMGDDTNWVVYQNNIKDTRCDVLNLEPFKDYSFRVRVENKFGLSDPSPTVTAFRSNLPRPHEAKKYQPEDYNIERIPKEKIAAAPKFLREEESSMYGVCKQPVTIEFWLYGYPEPNVTWYFNDTKIEQSEKFSFLQDRNGKTCLFLNRMEAGDVGTYTCVATNEHGEERKMIKLMLAEPPVFTKGLEETRVASRGHLKLECNVKGTPEPTLKWFKDFQPLHDTSRVKVIWDSPDHATLTISDLITRDQGLYSCTATNIAGSTTTAAFVHVDESAINYDKYPFSYKGAVKPKNKTTEQFYDLGDELGRGTQGITYHAVERSSGKSFAAKMMHGMGETKQYMNAELDIMNQLGMHERLVTLRDAFAATPHSMTLVMDMCGGGQLLDFILKKGQLSESEVADYIRQILEGLHYMHYKNIGHFGLTIGDVLLDRMNGSDIRICDFGLAQRVIPGINAFIEFGHPEFAAPEVVAKNPAWSVADIWSTGIIAHILLLGTSPFLGQNDRETLQNIQNKKLDLSDETLAGISEQGRDFIRKVLDFDPKTRLDVKAALGHPWLKSATLAEQDGAGARLGVMDRLRDYKSKYDSWYANASCRRYYRRRALHSCYTHPSRMIYPPDEQYSPMVSPDREINKYKKTISPFENVYPTNQAGETEHFSSDSNYQCGPDTYLLQLRDTAFPTRIRKYLRVAATNNASIAANLKQAHWGGNISAHMSGYIPQVSIKERRKFTDIMDEEITDERHGFSSRSRPMRLVREVGTSSYVHGQLSSIRKEIKGMSSTAERTATPTAPENLARPIFREKLKDSSYKVDDDHVLSCFAIGEPSPSYTWFRNDQILIESSRVEVKRLDDGRCELRIRPTREYDAGIYKCVASNSQGSVVCRARLCIGDIPGLVHPPTVRATSSGSCLLVWGVPRHQFNTPIIGYRVEYKRVDESEWHVAEDNIHQEYHQLNNLAPGTAYQARLAATNKYGTSVPTPPVGFATAAAEEGSHITLPASLQAECNCPEVGENNYKNENEPVSLIKSDFKELYDFKSILFKGKFSVIAQAYVKDGSRSMLACKCVLLQSEQESSVANEFEIGKSLAHEKIVNLLYANKDGNLFTLATPMYSGLNVLTYLARQAYYTEESVCRIITQVLDAIEYLNYRNIALLELQPDNVLVVDDRKLDIKLTDFANARLLKGGASAKVSIAANPEYLAPEMIKEEEVVLPYTDVWCVGVLAYILLSGRSPYRGNDTKETAQNVVFVRYLFDCIYPEVTQEAIRFLLTVFKLTPQKRPNIEECLDNKWLICNDFMVKKRENAVFATDKISQFADKFFANKSSEHSRLLDLIGLK